MRASILVLFAAVSLVLDRDRAATRRGGGRGRPRRWRFRRHAGEQRKAANQLQGGYVSVSTSGGVGRAYGYCD